MISKAVIEEKISEINGKPWSPVDVAKINDNTVQLALFDGEYHWHTHSEYDECFLVFSGKIIIQLRNQTDITLKAGETTVIPKGTEHCPKSVGPSYVLFAPQETDLKVE